MQAGGAAGGLAVSLRGDRRGHILRIRLAQSEEQNTRDVQEDLARGPRMPKSRKPTTIDAAALLASRKHHPGEGRNRTFSAARLPAGFQTVIDPRQHPEQPWRDLPRPTGQPPFRLSLDSVLSGEAIKTIEQSGRMVFHS